jgi:hypothetical protein
MKWYNTGEPKLLFGASGYIFRHSIPGDNTSSPPKQWLEKMATMPYSFRTIQYKLSCSVLLKLGIRFLYLLAGILTVYDQRGPYFLTSSI